MPRLHVAVDDLPAAEVLATVDAVLAAGGRAIQVRRASGTDRERVDLVRAVVTRAHQVGALVLVDDRLDLALAAGADGVHLGPDDLAVADARRLTEPGFRIGASAHDPASARRLVVEGADHLRVGPVGRPTDGGPLGTTGAVATIATITAAVDVPVLVRADIAADLVAEATGAGAAHGLVVADAITGAADAGAAVAAFLDALDHALRPAQRPITA